MPPSKSDGEEDEATRLSTLAKHAQEQGDSTRALLLSWRALAIREQALGPHHLDVATSLDHLARLYQEQKLRSERQHLRTRQLGGLPLQQHIATFLDGEQAVPLYERALAIREQALGPDHPDVATTLDTLGRLHQELGQTLASHGLLDLHQEMEKRGQIHTQRLTPFPPEYLDSLRTLHQRCQEEYRQALKLYQRALAIRQHALLPNHPDIATSLTNLAKFYEHADSLGTALQRLQHMATILERRVQEPRTQARLRQELERMQEPVQEVEREDALPFYEQALAMLEQTQPTHPDTAEVLEHLGSLYWDRDRSEEAITLWERALAIYEQTHGPTSRFVADTLDHLAEHYDELGQREHAVDLYQRVLTIYEREIPHDVETADLMEHLANLLDDLDQTAQADELRARRQAILDQQTG